MKKGVTILCIFFLLILGCSKSEDPNQEKPASINPPDWIKGVWLADTWIDAGYRFTSDDFCFISLCDESCKIEGIDSTSTSFEEVITDSFYSIAITNSNEINGGATRSKYEFEKISNNQIKRIGEDEIYTKEENDWINCSLFDSNKIYPLDNDGAWLVISVTNAPAQARVTIETHFVDGTVEKDESNPNTYLSSAIRIDKEAAKVILTVEDRDSLSGIDYTVLARLFSSDYGDLYFVLYEEDTRWVQETILLQ